MIHSLQFNKSSECKIEKNNDGIKIKSGRFFFD